MGIIVGNGHSNLDEAVYILQSDNIIGKSINPAILLLVMSK